MARPDAILIAGPTASGKSKHALELTERWDGEIVNTDSMQIYPVLRILTARPDDQDLAVVPHHLYGYAPLEEPYSVARWLKDVERVTDELRTRGKIPVFVGGTGLYFRALLQGLSETPEIPTEIRSEIRKDLLEQGSEVLHERLRALDPKSADALRPSDSHRISRALEVVVATGRSLLDFHGEPISPPLLADNNNQQIVLMPERPKLHERISLRTEMMFEQGAIEEVKQLLTLELPSESTVLRAIGVPQITDLIHGELSLKECIERVKTVTRQYAKRQSTWFRGQFDENWQIFEV